MSFPLEILKTGISIANNLTVGVQSTVQHYAFIGSDAFGKETYASPVNLLAIVDRSNRMIGQPDQQIAIVATLIFLSPITPNGSTGATINPPRREPIDLRDKIVLSDGTTGPLIDAPNSVTDPSNNLPLVPQIMIGAR